MHSCHRAHCLAATQAARVALPSTGRLPVPGFAFHSQARQCIRPNRVHLSSFLRTGSSLPVASHPVSRRRSYLHLRAASALPGEDFHLSVGARFQAHECGGTPPLFETYWDITHVWSDWRLVIKPVKKPGTVVTVSTWTKRLALRAHSHTSSPRRDSASAPSLWK